MSGLSIATNDSELAHWAALAAGLPAEGVRGRYRTEHMCRVRLAKVRWPGGPRCPKCQSAKFTHITARKIYLCGECRHQYTAISGGLLHGTHLKLSIWFHVAELIIEHNSRGRGELLTGVKLQELTGVATPRIYPLRKKLLNDLRGINGGYIGTVICGS